MKPPEDVHASSDDKAASLLHHAYAAQLGASHMRWHWG